MPVFRVPIIISWAGPGSPGVNVLHVRVAEVGGVWSSGDLQSAIDAIHTFYGAINTAYPAGTQLTLGDVMNMETQELATPSWTTITASGGTDQAPALLSICIGWRTSVAARRGMGRTFIGPLVGNVSDSIGTPAGGLLEPIRTAANALVTDSLSTTNGWALCVWGLQNPAPAGTAPSGYKDLPHVARDVTAARIKDRFAVMRSRRD